MAKTLYRPSKAVDIYIHSASGMKMTSIAKKIGVSPDTLKEWRNRFPSVKYALTKGREARKVTTNPDIRKQFLVDRLPKELLSIYQTLEELDYGEGDTSALLAIMEDQGEEARQKLFLYALLDSNFNPSKACSRCGISRQQVFKWIEKDSNFAEMYRAIDLQKRDWIEGQLMKLVRRGDTQAVIFANKALNADRGYADRLKVEHSGNVNHNINFSIDELDLDVETLGKIRDAVKRLKEARIEEAEKTIDV